MLCFFFCIPSILFLRYNEKWLILQEKCNDQLTRYCWGWRIAEWKCIRMVARLPWRCQAEALCTTTAWEFDVGSGWCGLDAQWALMEGKRETIIIGKMVINDLKTTGTICRGVLPMFEEIMDKMQLYPFFVNLNFEKSVVFIQKWCHFYKLTKRRKMCFGEKGIDHQKVVNFLHYEIRE